MTAAVPQTVGRVSRELYRDFADTLPELVIRACVRDAVADLRGSISAEALPEMAARLAAVRLARIADNHQHRDRRSPTREWR